MGYALKLNSVNFSEVAVDQVTYIEVVPCTGITLSANTATFDTYLATQTITATLAPADTTDTLTWTSSDDRVATVNGGVITIHGIGTATVTATCGSITATVSVSASSLKITDLEFVEGVNPDAHATDLYPTLATNISANTLAMDYNASDASTLHFANSSTAQLLPVLYGASTVKLVTNDSSGLYAYIVYYDTTNTVTYDGVVYATKTGKEATTITNALTVSNGQAIAYYAGSSTPLNKGSYVLFE